MKMGQNGEFVRRMFWVKFHIKLSVFLCLEMFRQALGSNLGIGKSKLGFWGENGGFLESLLSQLATALARRVGREQKGLSGAYLPRE
jgi:hypothetical protein